MELDGADDDLMRRFLLDDVTAEERARVEGRLLETEFADALSAMEEALIVQHLQGRLAPQWRDRFRAVYLETADGRAQVEAMAAFQHALVDATAQTAASGARHRGPVQRDRRRFLIPLAAAAIVTLVVASAIINRARVETPPPTTSDPGRAPEPRTVATFTLLPGLTRSEWQRTNTFRLPPDSTDVRLEWSVPAGVTGLQAAIRPVGGTPLSIANAPQVRSSGAQQEVAWVVPARLLPPGDYLLALTAETSAGIREPLPSRFFTIVN